MRLLLVGSIAHHLPGTGQSPAPEDTSLIEAAHAIGYEAVRTGHTVLLRDIESSNVIDRYVFRGIADYVQGETGRSASVQLHLPEDFSLKTQITGRGLQLKTYRYPGFPSLPQGHPGEHFNFLASLVAAIDLCDVIVTMGDGQSIRIAGILSALGKAPTLAVASFGGSSREIFAQNRVFYVNTFRDSALHSVLVEPWGENSAHDVLQLATRLADLAADDNEHCYFVSYAHEDAAIADHVELLLLRRSRRTLRDETALRLGTPQISDAIAALIAECDTFLAVGSSSYKQQEWCIRELAFAQEPGRRPRIVYIDTDQSGIPEALAHMVGVDGSSRSKRRHAIETLIAEERDKKDS